MVPRTTTTNATTTNGLTGAMGSFSLAQKSTTATIPSAKTETAASPALLAPPSYEDGVRSEVPSGKWTSFRWNDTSCPETINFDLILNSGYRSHNDETATQDLLELFQSAYASRSLIVTNMPNDPFLKNIISAIHRFQMVHAVYRLNFIERVGPSEGITTNLALMVFKDQKVLDIPTEYQEKERLSIFSLEKKEKGLTMKNVVISRREVIQHSKALMYILNAMINLDCPLTEELIKETHKILVTDLDIHGGDGKRTHTWQSYAGRYRRSQEHVSAETTNFLAPSKVAAAMEKLCSDFKEEVKAAEEDKKIDPIFLAAKYCQEFMMIHPFLDGNGRTCRLILSAILMKFMGVVIGIGGNEDERAQYLGICRSAGEEMEGPGELASLVLEKVGEGSEKMNGPLVV